MVETKFKQTDVGLIPEDWEVKKLGELLSIGNGRDYKHLSYGDVPVYGTGGLMCYVNDYLYDGETVCIGRKGTINVPFYYSGKIWTVDTLFFTHSFNNIVPKYLYYLFLTIDWLSKNEATGVPSLSKINIGQINVAIPPTIAEQERIASALTSIDNLISSLDKQIAKTRNIKQGAMRQLLTFPDNVPLRPLGESLFFEQPTKYIVKSSDYYDAGLPVLTAGQSFILGYTKEKEGVFKVGEDNPVIIFDDFTTSFHWVDFNFKVKSSAMKMLRPSSNKVSFKYVYYAMSRITYEPVEHSRQWISVYSNFTIPVPSIEEQQRIASTLTAMDNQIATLEAKRRKYEMLKQGMMRQLLTGKIRLGKSGIPF